MYWYKVKTLLIYMFVAINIFLVVFIVHGKVRQNLYDMQEIKSLTGVLQNNDITVSEGILSKENRKIKTATIENLISSGEDMAKIMFGEQFDVITDENGAKKYVSGAKVISAENGILNYADTEAAPDNNLTEDKIQEAARLLIKYNIDVKGASGEIHGDKVVFTYNYDGRRLFGNTLYVKLSGDKVCEIGGQVVKFKEKGKIKTKSTADALVMFLRDKNRTDGEVKVVSAELGYSVLLADEGISFKITETIPTYRITTDKNQQFYYDARQ